MQSRRNGRSPGRKTDRLASMYLRVTNPAYRPRKRKRAERTPPKNRKKKNTLMTVFYCFLSSWAVSLIRKPNLPSPHMTEVTVHRISISFPICVQSYLWEGFFLRQRKNFSGKRKIAKARSLMIECFLLMGTLFEQFFCRLHMCDVQIGHISLA